MSDKDFLHKWARKCQEEKEAYQYECQLEQEEAEAEPCIADDERLCGTQLFGGTTYG